jgi:hypothetical protein
MSRTADLIDELANELSTWPGVQLDAGGEDRALVRYEDRPLGTLDREQGVVELTFPHPEHEALIAHGDAEPADPEPDSDTVRHEIHGPADVTAAIELFDRRYRELRGADEPYSSQDS